MRAFLEHHRHLALLVLVLFGQLLLLAYQIKTENEMRLIRLWAVTLITPIEKGVDFLGDATLSLGKRYLFLYRAERDNRWLREELRNTQLRLHALADRAADAERLGALLKLKQAYPQAALLAAEVSRAEVIGASAVATSHTVFVNRGRQDNVERDHVVLTPEGIVGKVIHVFPASAQVLLITDAESGVGAMLADSRVQGVVKGTGRTLCRLEYVPNEESVAVGARVLTSGKDQLFPKGFPIGTVASVEPGDYFLEILVKPTVRLNQLEYVSILAGAPPTLPVAAADSHRD
ncbi:MAG: rod shape-determining protein MreC [Terriglobia bacterium]